jgi:hypothetical protein
MSTDIALACEDPENCPNGPEPHDFIPDNETVLPCFRQSWEQAP